MFTGIIQDQTAVLSVKPCDGSLGVRFEKPHGWKLTRGQSIAIDGVCSTVMALDEDSFEVEYMPETRKKTTVDGFVRGRRVNLERSLSLRDFIDGHLVQGHIDARGRVSRLVNEGTNRTITVTVPDKLMRFIAPRGSVAVNGVSLTVASTTAKSFTVALIPYTLQHTNLGTLEAKDAVNIEVDMLARYVVAASASVRKE